MKALEEEVLGSYKESFGPDPVLMKKIGATDQRPNDLDYYKKKIKDKKYIDHAIHRIAMELSHFLSR